MSPQERVDRVLNMAKGTKKHSYYEYEYYKERIGRISGLTCEQYQNAIKELCRIIEV